MKSAPKHAQKVKLPDGRIAIVREVVGDGIYMVEPFAAANTVSPDETPLIMIKLDSTSEI